MRIMLASPILSLTDLEFNRKQIISYIHKAGKENVSLVLFSEASLTGFESMTFDYKEDILRALSEKGSELAEIRKAAIDNRVSVGVGFHENYKGGIYSSYIIIGETGETVDLYRRTSKGWRISEACADYREGNGFHSFSLNGIKMTTMICGDLWEDDLISSLTDLDDETDVYIWPVHCDISPEEWNDENSDMNDPDNISNLA